MEPRFEYRRIGKSFRNELADLVSSRQSAVLLGLRDLGKRYALRQLGDDLALDGAAIVVEVEFPHEPALSEAAAVQSFVTQAVQRATPELTLQPDLSNDLLSTVRQLSDLQRRPVVLLASNVDSLAHHLAQLLLRETRALVGNHRLTVVLTGEHNLRDLVFGPDSEFNCAHQFVIQGFDEQEFMAYMRRRREVAQMVFADEHAYLSQLFRQTGGNNHLARTAMWSWLEVGARSQDPHNRMATPETFLAFLETFHLSDACGADVFQRTTQTVSRAPEAWSDLADLLENLEVEMPHGSRPHALELAGLAIREGERLRFASPIMQRFAERYFDACRLGDLYAVQGNWEKSLAFYLKMPESRRLRPCGAEDLPRLALVTRAFAARLHAIAAHKGEVNEAKLDELKDLFMHGCHMLLGLPEITFWSRKAGTWKPQVEQKIDSEVVNLGSQILHKARLDAIGWQRASDSTSQRGAYAILPSIRPDCRDAVVVSDTRGRVAISRERQEILGEMLDQFANAYDHSIAALGIKRRLEVRDRHFKVATGILNVLGDTARNPREVFMLAGTELLKLGYRRIMFALIDPTRQRIRGLIDCAGEGCPIGVKVSDETIYALAEPDKDIQAWVAAKNKACVVDDWRTWNGRRGSGPLVNVSLCQRARTPFAFAVVPMRIRKRQLDGSRTWTEEVFGTIHFERVDGLIPSDEEIEDLFAFGSQLAAVAKHGELIHALLAALNHDQEAVAILDADASVRFVNRLAAKRLDLSEGWHEAQPSIQLCQTIHSEIIADCREVLASSKPKVRHLISPPGAAPSREVILCAPLSDWRLADGEQPEAVQPVSPIPAIGVVLQLRDLTPIHQLALALEKMAESATDSDSIITALMQCIADLGYTWARLYRVDPQNNDLLFSVRAMGLEQKYTEEFNSGTYRMHRPNPASGDTWRCLDTGEPQIHQWNPQRPDMETKLTKWGLTLTNFQSPGLRKAWKRPGDVWIDLPLLANGRPIGKLSIDCGQNSDCELTPEDFELLRLCSALLGALLDGLNRKERWMKDAADKAMATCAHNIRAKLAALDGFARNYRAAAPGNLDVETLNRLYQPAVDGSFRQVTRIKDTFVILQLQRSPRRVRQLLEETLEGKFGAERRADRVEWAIACDPGLEFNLDAERFCNALEEMIENSRVMLPPKEKLELELHAEVELRGDRPWLCIRLQDNGPGIPAKKRDRVFEPFFSERPDGKRSTGLGLNFVRRVVEAHGGKISIMAEHGEGAGFFMEIPEPQSNA